MNFKVCFGSQHVPKVIAFGPDTLNIVQTISCGLKSKFLSISESFGIGLNDLIF